jgi:hypothetical protein
MTKKITINKKNYFIAIIYNIMCMLIFFNIFKMIIL